jgi:hypothetical protein
MLLRNTFYQIESYASNSKFYSITYSILRLVCACCILTSNTAHTERNHHSNSKLSVSNCSLLHYAFVSLFLDLSRVPPWASHCSNLFCVVFLHWSYEVKLLALTAFLRRNFSVFLLLHELHSLHSRSVAAHLRVCHEVLGALTCTHESAHVFGVGSSLGLSIM